MGCRILSGEADGSHDAAVFYCSTTGVAFGPLMVSREVAEAFCKSLADDPRKMDVSDLISKYGEFVHEQVCACGDLRQSDCEWCEADSPIVEREGKRVHIFPRCKHCNESEADHYYHPRKNLCDVNSETPVFEAGDKEYIERCTRDRAPENGERFECEGCRERKIRTAERKAATRRVLEQQQKGSDAKTV